MAKNLIELVVGDLSDKKRYRQYKARVKALPAGYRDTAKALERYVMYLGASDDGSTLVRMLDDLAELLEQSSADGMPIRRLVGEDPVEFAEAFIAAYPGGSWIRKEQARLAESIDRAIEQTHGDPTKEGPA